MGHTVLPIVYHEILVERQIHYESFKITRTL